MWKLCVHDYTYKKQKRYVFEFNTKAAAEEALAFFKGAECALYVIPDFEQTSEEELFKAYNESN